MSPASLMQKEKLDSVMQNTSTAAGDKSSLA